MPMFNSVWDTVPGLVDRLKALIGPDKSMAQIAKELGNGLTRNAVIGKVRRLGLAIPRAKASISAEKVIRKRGKTRLHISNTNSHPIMEFEVIESVPAPSDMDIPKEQRKTILQLERWHCRFPVGEPEDPNFFFCGATVAEGLSYCQHHADRCYTPAHRRSPQFIKPQF